MDEEQLRGVCKQLGVETDPSMGKGKLIDEIFGEKCEHHYIQPTFIMDYPVEMSPLCKKHRDNPELTERFELMVNGKELCNAYSELNDPIDQYERFREQMELSAKGDDEAMFIDMDFVRALEYGVITSYSIHYTKLYDRSNSSRLQPSCRWRFRWSSFSSLNASLCKVLW